jgi:hypothetical protein
MERRGETSEGSLWMLTSTVSTKLVFKIQIHVFIPEVVLRINSHFILKEDAF